MPVVLALVSALLLGTADFVGGLAARRAPSGVVVVWSNAIGLVGALLVAGVVPAVIDEGDLAWGILAGTSGSLGAVLLYRALAVAPMSLVAPTTAVTTGVIPVVVGATAGEALTLLRGAGVAVALVSVVLISRTGRRPPPGVAARRGLGYAVLSGVSFGAFLVLLAQTSGSSGLWPLIAARSVSICLLVVLAAARRQDLRLTPAASSLAVLAGALDMSANVTFLAAIRSGELSVVGLLASLAPLGTVLLARVLLKERLVAVQRVGAALAIGSVLLLAVR